MLITWLSLAVVCLLGAMSPGPSFVVVARNALYLGRGAGLLAAWAHAMGIGCWAFLTVAGLSVIVQTVPALFVTISVLGGAYLGWLGIGAFRQSSSVLDTIKTEKAGSPWRGAREGALIAFLNPKTGLFFLALFSPFVARMAGTTWQCVMVATPFFTDGIWFSVVTFVLIRPRVLGFLKSRAQLVNRISGAVLLLFAVIVGWHAIQFLLSCAL